MYVYSHLVAFLSTASVRVKTTNQLKGFLPVRAYSKTLVHSHSESLKL